LIQQGHAVTMTAAAAAATARVAVAAASAAAAGWLNHPQRPQQKTRLLLRLPLNWLRQLQSKGLI
jgi:hypothetical protein